MDAQIRMRLGVARDVPGVSGWMFRRLMPLFVPLMSAAFTAEESGQGLARLVTDPALAGTGGRHFLVSEELAPPDDATDPARGRDLWAASEALVAQVLRRG